jgi:uncharacterized membrane protein
MPFIFLAIALALNVFLNRQAVDTPFWVWKLDFAALLDGRIAWDRHYYRFSVETFLFAAVFLGGLAFLNIWDWPWYVGLFSGAYVLRRAQQTTWHWGSLWEFIRLGVLLGIAGGLAYLPYYLGFSSQAGGVLPNVINPTRGIHLWVVFGSLLVPLFVFLVHLIRQKRDVRSLLPGFSWTLVGTLFLFAGSVITVLVLGRFAGSGGFLGTAVDNFFGMFSGIQSQELLRISLTRRVDAISGLLTLVVLLGLAVAVLWPKRRVDEEHEFKIEVPEIESTQPFPRSHIFAALLILFGGLLVIIPEFVFLRDLFNHRMNTIFKFYYQAWLLWGVAAAYGSAVLLNQRNFRGTLYGVLLAVVLTLGLTYPLMALNTRISGFQNRADPQLNLDGTSATSYFFLSPDEKQAVGWLQQAPLGTLVEAVGGSYSNYARISSNSGQPALLGWAWHEEQWRGSRDPAGTREQDIHRLYSTPNWPEADEIIQQYGIQYIVVGSLERNTYQVQEEKFNRYLTTVFQTGTITIYQTSITVP